jgi:CheY-like chemotaxis protein
VRAVLHQALEEIGYAVQETEESALALTLLRATPERWVVICDVLGPRYAGASLLQAALQDEALERKHAFLLLSAMVTLTPLADLRARLSRHPPVDTEVISLAMVLDTVEEAVRQLGEG